MNSDKQWMIMTYYCPTHGSGEKCEPIQLTKDDLLKADKKYKSSNKPKLINWVILNFLEKIYLNYLPIKIMRDLLKELLKVQVIYNLDF